MGWVGSAFAMGWDGTHGMTTAARSPGRDQERRGPQSPISQSRNPRLGSQDDHITSGTPIGVYV